MAGLEQPAPPKYSDEQVKRLSAALQISRARFAEVFDPLSAENHGDSLKLVQAMAEDKKSFYPALAYAQGNGWLPDLISRLLHAGALPDEPDEQVQVDLQAIVDERLGFQDVGRFDAGFLTARRRVCHIKVQAPGGDVFGTGFLVGPQTILTSYHVIRSQLDANNQPLPNSDSNIKATFGKVSGLRDDETVGVMKSWLVLCSPTHPSESPPTSIVDFDGEPPEGFDQKLDYALLRLASPVGRQRGYYTLDRTRKPCIKPPRTQVTLFQHPAGGDMQVAYGAGSGLWPPGIETRMQHSANSMAGSSGGLILDADLQPVALHQCGYKKGGGAFINGAIPTACIVAAASNDAAFTTVDGVDPIWRLPQTGDPVLGRDLFQGIVQDAAFDRKRIVSIFGDPSTGKTFCLKIMEALLGQAEHAVVELTPADRSANPRDFAAAILTKVGDQAGVDKLPQAKDAESAQGAWVRDALYPYLVERLRTAAGTKNLWLVLDDLDTNGLPDTATRQLLEAIYQGIVSTPFLRVVLLGLRGPVPAAPPALVAYYETQVLTEEDVRDYAERRDTELGGKRSDVTLKALALATMNSAGVMSLSRVPAVAAAVKAVLDPTLGAAP